MYHPHTASDAKQISRQNRQDTKGGGLLQKTGMDLPRRGADAGKDAKLVNPRVHGHRKGIVDNHNQ